jgi:hypothetical protein
MNPKPRNGSVEKGKNALIGVIERDVTRVEVRPRCLRKSVSLAPLS